MNIFLDYEQLLIDNQEQAFERVKTAYFDTFKEIFPILGIKYFDVDGFIVDLKKILS